MKPLLSASLVVSLFVSMTAPVSAANKEDVQKAIEAGIKALKKAQDDSGFWMYDGDEFSQVSFVGATGLAGLALLEAGVDKKDESIQRAAQAIRLAALDLTHTYSLSAAIFFLDKLGEKEDKAFIKSMAGRLMAGQARNGQWTYWCPSSRQLERSNLATALKTRAGTHPEDGVGKPTRTEAATAAEQILRKVVGETRARVSMQALTGDNSNTQFALMALWVARRHECSVDKSLKLVEEFFRTTQNDDGGWSYRRFPSGSPLVPGPGGPLSSPAMTCAGLLGLAVGQVTTQTSLRTKNASHDHKTGSGDISSVDLSRDKGVQAGLAWLEKFLPRPRPAPRNGPIPNGIFTPANRQTQHLYYTLWSVERMGVAFGIDKIGEFAWYDWGAEQIIGAQTYWTKGTKDTFPDAAFALLFLSRSNVARDLTTALKTKGQGVDQATVKTEKGARPNVASVSKPEPKPVVESALPPPPTAAPPVNKPATPVSPASPKDAVELSKELIAAKDANLEGILDQFRKAKGTEYTERLAGAIPSLGGESKKKARQALADRLVPMTSETLKDKLSDNNPEIRRAAAIASGMKEDRSQIPQLIELLQDREALVNRAALASLKSLTGQDFGPAKGAEADEVVKAVSAWRIWYKENVGK